MKLARLGQGPEIFLSLQGEGKHQGRPSVFVRSSRCNLFCTFCDTPHTWNWADTAFVHLRDPRKFNRERETVELSPLAIVDWIGRFACRNVVLTGGEPLLQAEECAAVARHAQAADSRYQFEVETNGTIVPPYDLACRVGLFTVSPKLAHSGVPETLRRRDEVLEWFARSERSVFKLVVRNADDLGEVRQLCQRHDIDADRVFLMPEAVDRTALAEARQRVAALCLTEGYRYSDRLHIQLYGNQPGT
jgi:organic radical activating enzyme